jgi:hypothetical protein
MQSVAIDVEWPDLTASEVDHRVGRVLRVDSSYVVLKTVSCIHAAADGATRTDLGLCGHHFGFVTLHVRERESLLCSAMLRALCVISVTYWMLT